MSVNIHLGSWQDTLDGAGPARVADASVRLLLTSPPYDNARTYEVTQIEPVDFDALARFALRALMPGGMLAMVLDGAINDGEQSTTPYRVICDWAALKGWRLLQVLAYGRTGAPGAYKGRFRKDHEPLILFVKDGADHVCVKSRVAVESKNDLVRAIGTAGVRRRDGSQEKFGQDSKGNVRTVENIRHRGSFWDYGMVGNGQDASSSTGHPATFAERFALDAVHVWSNPGDLVCDTYSGSGTVAKACRDLDRSFVGAERVPLYHEMSLRRLDPTHISEARAQEPVGPLFGGPTREAAK